MEGQATSLGRDKRRIRRALVDKSCDGGRRGRRTDRGAGLGRRAGTIDRCRGGAADAAGTSDGCGGGHRRRMRRKRLEGQAVDAAGGTCGGRDRRRTRRKRRIGGGVEAGGGQATCEGATRGGGACVSVRAATRRRRDCMESATEARRWGSQATDAAGMLREAADAAGISD